MMSFKLSKKFTSILLAIVVFAGYCCWQVPIYAASSVNNENIITDVKNPSNGVITYKVTVPPGEKIDYSVELTPDKKYGKTDIVSGTLTNKTKKTVTKKITANVKFFSDKYKVTASYSKYVSGHEIFFRDSDSTVSTLKTSAVTAKVKWDFSKLGKGNKEWKYRYKYVPCKNGMKKYIEVFDKNGKRIQNYVKQTISIKNITKIIKEMKN